MTHEDSRGPTEKRKIFADGLVVFPNAILVSDGIVLHDAEQVLNRRGARFVVQRWQTFDATNGGSEKLRRTQTSKYKKNLKAYRQVICVFGTATFRQTFGSTLVFLLLLNLREDFL